MYKAEFLLRETDIKRFPEETKKVNIIKTMAIDIIDKMSEEDLLKLFELRKWDSKVTAGIGDANLFEMYGNEVILTSEERKKEIAKEIFEKTNGGHGVFYELTLKDEKLETK